MKILISFIGKSDPVRDDYDGPMIHILRHLNIKKAYLLGTRDLLTQKRVFVDRAISFIESKKNVKILSEYIPLEIKDPSVFSDFNLKAIMDKIYQENEGSNFIFNMSSATQQMVAALALDIVVNNRKGEAYQVKHYNPEKGKESKEAEVNYDFNNLMDNLKDIEPRLVKTNIASFKISKLKTELKATLKVKDYSKLMKMVKEYEIEDKELLDLIEYAYNANRLSEFPENNLKRVLKRYPDLLRFNKYKNKEYESENIILNYFLSWENELYKENYVSAILKLKPLFYEVMKYVIVKYFKSGNFDLNSRFYRNFSRNKRILMSDISDFDVELANKFSGGSNTIIFDTQHLLTILKHYEITEHLLEFEIIREIEFDIRNKLAHDINNKIKNQNVKSSAIKSHKNIEKVIKDLFKEYEKGINYQFFNQIDELILEKTNNLQTNKE